MKKRLLPLLVLAVAIVLITAPAAMADHCRKCSLQQTCAIAVTGGFPICDDSTGTCILQGTKCTGPHPLVEEPLAVEFTVASVERLDEPNTAPANLVASAAPVATPQSATR
jgi:hypothetical protein